MYIVSGATGNTGSVVAKILLEKGLPVRVIVRSEEKGKALKDLGAEIAVADLQNTDAVSEALKGGTILYLMNPPSYQSENQFLEAEKIIKSFQLAIGRNSLEKIVALSSIGAQHASGTGNILTTHRLEKAFENSSIPITFVRAGSFMENWNSVLETVKTNGVLPSFFNRPIAKFRRLPPRISGAWSSNQCRKKPTELRLRNSPDFGLRPKKLPKHSAKFWGQA